MNLKYYGILQGYPRIRKLVSKIADIITILRPFTLFGAFIAGFSLDTLFSRPNPNLVHALLMGFVLAFLQAGGQALNQSIAEEVAIDKINKKDYRPTVAGRMSLREGKFISLFLFISGITLANAMGFWCGIISFLIALFAIAYTIPPLRVKRFFLFSNIWQGISRGFLPIILVASVYNIEWRFPLCLGVIITIWVTGAQTTKDFVDIEGDRAYGIRTLPVVLGKKDSIELMESYMFLSFGILIAFFFLGWIPLSLVLAYSPLFVLSLLISWALKTEREIKFAENNLSWILFYVTLALFYMIPALIISD